VFDRKGAGATVSYVPDLCRHLTLRDLRMIKGKYTPAGAMEAKGRAMVTRRASMDFMHPSRDPRPLVRREVVSCSHSFEGGDAGNLFERERAGAQLGLSEVGSAEVGLAEVGAPEIGAAEVGPGEVGTA